MTYKDFLENQIEDAEYFFFSNIDGDDIYIYFSADPSVSVKVMRKYEYENREMLARDVSELINFACEEVERLSY